MAHPRGVNRRWLVPLGIVGAFLAAAAAPNLIPSAGASTPDLPTLSAAQLLAKVQSSAVATFSGDVWLVSDLGLPSLGNLTGGASATLTSLATGTHDAHVWYGGADHVRIALPAPLAETDWIRNGADLWSWDSSTQDAVHATHTPDTKDPAATDVPDITTETPVQFAQRLLDDVTPSTDVSVRTPRYVAGRPVYELVLAPRSSTSTVAEAVLSVDAATGVPLDARVVPKGSTSPAFEFGFTNISFNTPSASEFTFTPPQGAHVTQAGNADEMVFGRIPHGPHGEHVARIKLKGAGKMTAKDRANAIGEAKARALAASPVPGQPTEVHHVGQNWDTVLVISGRNLGGFGDVLSGATKVGSGATSGRLVTTRLVNVLVLDNGRILIGAVTPAALAAAAAAT